MRDRSLCAEISAETAEPLEATASRIDHWLLVEYRGLWARDLLSGSRLDGAVQANLREQLASLPRSRLLFVRRPQRAREAGIVVYVGQTSEVDSAFFGFEFESYEELAQLDLAGALRERKRPLSHPLLAVCTHGKRDRCCARYGRPLYDAMREQVDPNWVWQASHVGGDRFAGNVVCFPQGLYFGRVGRRDTAPLLDEFLDGRIYLRCFRGRCCYPFPVQAAEQAVRERSALAGIDDLRLAAAHRHPDEMWSVSFQAVPTGEVHTVEVRTELGDLTYLTCSAPTLQRPRRFVATEHRVERVSAGTPPGPAV